MWKVDPHPTSASDFDFPHLKYYFPPIWKVLWKYGKYWFWVTCKKRKKMIANFHVLGLFISKKQVRSENQFQSATRRCRFLLDEICIDDISAALRATDLRFWLPIYLHLGWIDAPHTQNFEMSRANLGVKKN
jgi:hypothetical protein